jgi:hypothetical protein
VSWHKHFACRRAMMVCTMANLKPALVRGTSRLRAEPREAPAPYPIAPLGPSVAPAFKLEWYTTPRALAKATW